MTADLELRVVQDPCDDLGHLAAFAITDDMIVAAGGTSSRAPTLLASSNARHFEPRTTPRRLGLRDVLAVGDALWACGEYGQLAISRDRGASWRLFETGTDVCLFGLALAGDGAVWTVGDAGFAARVLGERPQRIELGTAARLTAVRALREELVVLGSDGAIRRWCAGAVATAPTGATRALNALAFSRLGTWVVVGDGGFIARSPDGAWFTRVEAGVEDDLEAIATLADGRLVIVGAGGRILISADDGRTWTCVAAALTAHLWTVERFGGGALIGGDAGLVARLAPVGDASWEDRADVFGSARPLDAVFAGGPHELFAHGLPAYFDAIAAAGEVAGGAPEAPRAAPAGGIEAARAAPDGDVEAHEVLARAGDRASFERTYGLALPGEAVRLLDAVAGRGRWASFGALRLHGHLPPDVGDHNLFELLVRRAQRARDTGLVEAFCGVCGIGSQPGGDTYHLELHAWDGPRQVLHFDHRARAFTGVVADSLASLVYLAALIRAHELGAISRSALAHGLHALRGKVAPAGPFAVADHDPEFTPLDARRRDTEFFFYRSRWICALLEHGELDEVRALFMADFNQVVPPAQLPARFEACETFIPSALYSMWRAFLFDEPELARYLEIGRGHGARLVRDAARLIDELRAGRRRLGTIEDVPAWLAAFRALGLDPRGGRDAAASTAAGDPMDAARELERAPRAEWTELAWRWLGDGDAHRALLRRLDREPALAAQIAALDELRALPAGERALALPRVAAALAPELEAVLVGSLVRGDALTGVLSGTSRPGAPGWAAIDRALATIYGGAEPHAHLATALPYARGGDDPLHGISVYLRDEPVPHFHFVTYGFTDLFVKETDDPEESGFGFELTFRLVRAPDDRDVPAWAPGFLQNLARYVFGTGNRFAAGHKMGLNYPLAADEPTRLAAVLFAPDPELPPIDSELGKATFLQVVGITEDEYRLIQEWSTAGLASLLGDKLPLLATDLGRDSLLADPAIAAEIRRRVEREGSSEDLSFAGDMALEVEPDRIRIELGALYAAALPRAMRGRLRHGRPYTLRGRSSRLQLRPGEAAAVEREADALVLVISSALAAELEERLRAGLAGCYRFAAWPALEIVVTPTFIRDREGRAVEARGIADPDVAARLIEAENARGAAEADEDDDASDDDAPDPERVRAALAMTERARRLAPDDAEVQFAHAMLLIDAARAGQRRRLGELLAELPRLVPAVRLQAAVRLARVEPAAFVTALEAIVCDEAALCDEDLDPELVSELGEAVLAHAPGRLAELAGVLPPDVNLLAELAFAALQAGHPGHAMLLYERLLGLPVPAGGLERAAYLRALDHACVQAHAAGAYDAAVRIADLAQPLAPDYPGLYHAAACAYAAVGDHARAFAQVRLAAEHDYEHLDKLESDEDLGPLLEWPEFKTLFREWRARQEGN